MFQAGRREMEAGSFLNTGYEITTEPSIEQL